MPPVERPAWRIREQRDVRTGRRCRGDAVKQMREHGVTDPASLVLGQDSHVDDVEVPTAVADDPTEPDDFPVVVRDDRAAAQLPLSANAVC